MTVGRDPWDVEMLLTEPSRFEGKEVVMSHTVRGFNLSDTITIDFRRDDRVLSLPFRFMEDPRLIVDRVISIRGTSRLLTDGAILVEDYHLASTRPKLLLGLVGLAFLAAYILSHYRFIWHQMVWERRDLA